MINTIFWFADTKRDYDYELGAQGISDKTIVFIRETGEIYVNNKKYGKTLQDILNDPEMASVFNNNSALKQQIQLMIDQLESKHDADIAELTGTVNSHRAAQIADKEELNRKINNNKSELDVKINSAKNELNGIVESAQQDAETARQNIINSVNSSISDMNSILANATNAAQAASLRADQIYSSIDSTVNSAVQSAIADANISGNFGQVNTRIGNLENGLSAVTNRVDKFADNNGNIKYEVYQSIINSIVDDDSVLTEIGSKVATANQLTDDEVDVVQWWASLVQTYAQQGSTFAQMVAAVGGSGSGNEGVNEAYVLAKIEEALDGYVALSELNAKIQDCQAFINVKSTANTASANVLATQGNIDTINSNINSLLDDIDALETAGAGFDTRIAGLTTRVSDTEAKTSFIANYSANSGATFSLTANEAESLMNSIVQYENAVATIKAVTTTDESGVDINSIVDGKIETALSGYATRNWVDTESGLLTSITNITNAIKNSNGQLISSADILSKANANEASINALSTTVSGNSTAISGLTTSTNSNAQAITGLTSRVTTVEDGITSINNAGFVSSANLDSAVAGLFAESSNSNSKQKVKAYIQADVQDGISSITLGADKITFDGYANFTNAVKAVDIDASKITTGKLSADRIDVDGITIAAGKITGLDSVITDKIAATSITANSLQIKNSSNEVTAALNADGSGQIGKGGVTWTTSGGLKLSQAFLASLFQEMGDGKTSGSTYKGDSVGVVMAANDIPLEPEINIGDRSVRNNSIKGLISYYSWASPTGQYPVYGSISDKKNYLEQYAYAYSLNFTNGFFTDKTKVYAGNNRPFSELTSTDLPDVRVATLKTESEIKQWAISHFDLSESKFQGVTTTSSPLPYVSSGSSNYAQALANAGKWWIMYPGNVASYSEITDFMGMFTIHCYVQLSQSVLMHDISLEDTTIDRANTLRMSNVTVTK